MSEFKANIINIYSAKTDKERTQKLNEIIIKLIKERIGGAGHEK